MTYTARKTAVLKLVAEIGSYLAIASLIGGKCFSQGN